MLSPTANAQRWVRDEGFKPSFVIARDVNLGISGVATVDGDYLVFGGAREMGSNLYLGSEPFERLGEDVVPPLLRLDATGQWDRSFHAAIPAGQRILRVLPTHDGGAWVQWEPDLTTVDDSSAIDDPNSVLPMRRLRRDGSIDPSVVPFSTTKYAQVVALEDGGLLVDSSIQTTDEGPGRILVRRDRWGRLDHGFQLAMNLATAPRGSVMVSPDQRIYVTSSNVETGKRELLRLQPNGSIDDTFNWETDVTYSYLPLNDGFIHRTNDRLERYDFAGNKRHEWLLPSGDYDHIESVHLLEDGSLRVAVSRWRSSNDPDTVSRLDSVIELDSELKQRGDWQTKFNRPTNVFLAGLQPNGRTLVVMGPIDADGEHAESATLAVVTAASVTPLSLEFYRDFATTAHLVRVDETGRALFTGNFNRVNGITRDGTARLLFNGSLDPNFNPGPITPAFALRDGGAILVKRETSDSSAFEWRRLTSDGRIVVDANLSALRAHSGTRFWAEADDGKLLISHYDGEPGEDTPVRLAWLNADGSVDQQLPPTFLPIAPRTVYPRMGVPYLRYPISRVQPLADGMILVQGQFDDVSGQPTQGLVRLAADGNLDPAFADIMTQAGLGGNETLLPDGSFIDGVSQPSFDGSQPLYRHILPNGETDPDFAPQPQTPLGTPLRDGRFYTYEFLRNPDGSRDNGLNLSEATDFGQSISEALIDDFDRLWITTYTLTSRHPHESVTVARFVTESFSGVAGISPDESLVQGRLAAFNVTPGSPEFTAVQWYRNGVPIPGAEQTRLTLPHTIARDAGTYHAEVTFASGVYASDTVQLALEPNTTRIRNFSARSLSLPEHPQIGGFINEVTDTRPVLIRAVGLGIGGYLPDYAVSDFLPRPALTLFDAQRQVLARDLGSLFAPDIEVRTAAVGAFSGRPPHPFYDPTKIYGSALALELPRGPHTVHVNPEDGVAGLSLLEFHDAVNDETRALRNVSLRAWSARGNDVMIGGFILQGNGPTPMLIRAIGPTLERFGVSPVVADPKLKLFASGGGLITENDDWEATPEMRSASAKMSAFELPEGSKDSAVLVWLNPGAYTAMVDIGEGDPAEALLEIYWVDPD